MNNVYIVLSSNLSHYCYFFRFSSTSGAKQRNITGVLPLSCESEIYRASERHGRETELERERETEPEKDRAGERQSDRDRAIERQSNRERDRARERQSERETDR